MVQDKKKKNKKNKNKNKNQANETPPEVVPQAEVPAEPIANGLTTNANQTIQNDESSVMKSLTAEASQWTTYNWAAIQDAEAKYQTYLATKRKVHFNSQDSYSITKLNFFSFLGTSSQGCSKSR